MQKDLEERTFIDETTAIPKKVLKEIITHKHYRAFLIYLQLKPLYVSGTIMNDNGKLPYRKIAAYLQLSISGVRGKIRQLKKHKLIHGDDHKNFHLASYQKFVCIFQPQFHRRMKKYRYRNVADADVLVKTAAIEENFKKQNYILKNKIINKELYGTVNAHKDRINSPKGFNDLFAITNDCQQSRNISDFYRPTSARRKIRKALMKDYDNLLLKAKNAYMYELEQIQHGFPDINPYVTLSCSGMGRLFGIGPSAGHYQRNKIVSAGIINIKLRDRYNKVHGVSQDVKEQLSMRGSNIYSFNYPVKRNRSGMQEKFFLRLPDILEINLFFIYENAKN